MMSDHCTVVAVRTAGIDTVVVAIARDSSTEGVMVNASTMGCSCCSAVATTGA
jgi:hypothetical protein